MTAARDDKRGMTSWDAPPLFRARTCARRAAPDGVTLLGRLGDRVLAPGRRPHASLLVERVREVGDALESDRVRDLSHGSRARLEQFRRALESHPTDEIRRALAQQVAQLPMEVAAALRDLARETLDAEALVAQVGLDDRANLVEEHTVRRRRANRRRVHRQARTGEP